MPNGSFILEFQMPTATPNSTLTYDEISKLVHKHIKRHFVDLNFEPARYTWLDRPDVPSTQALMPQFIRDCIGETGIDSGLVDPLLAGKIRYCIFSTTTVCYSAFSLGWKGPDELNPFKVLVPFPSGGVATVELSSMLTVIQPGTLL